MSRTRFLIDFKSHNLINPIVKMIKLYRSSKFQFNFLWVYDPIRTNRIIGVDFIVIVFLKHRRHHLAILHQSSTVKSSCLAWLALIWWLESWKKDSLFDCCLNEAQTIVEIQFIDGQSWKHCPLLSKYFMLILKCHEGIE